MQSLANEQTLEQFFEPLYLPRQICHRCFQSHRCFRILGTAGVGVGFDIEWIRVAQLGCGMKGEGVPGGQW